MQANRNFRPTLGCLEDRAVPAAISGVLSKGVVLGGPQPEPPTKAIVFTPNSQIKILLPSLKPVASPSTQILIGILKPTVTPAQSTILVGGQDTMQTIVPINWQAL